jgi:cytochrome c biogenesis protein CcmG, thiol:disulfide interchange protein DsbE
MPDYLVDLKHALQEAAAREYPAGEAHRSVFGTLRARIRSVGGRQTRVALARMSLVLPVGLSVVIFVLAVALLHRGHGQHDRAHFGAQHAPQTGRQRVDPVHRPQLAIDSALEHGIDPPAPDQSVPLPILGAAGTRTLTDFRGHIVVLNLFASWCDPCRAESASLEQTQRRIERQGATVLGVTYLSDAAAAERFVRAEHITYPVLRDTTRRVATAFGINGVPETFVIDRDGRIVAARRHQVGHRWLAQALARARHAGAK